MIFYLLRFNRIDLINIPGKRSRPVPMLLLPLVREAMDTLVHVRQKESFCPENKYFFASDSPNGYISQWKVLSEMSRRAQLQKPELMRSTKLRKYMATVAQVSLLKNWLCCSVSFHKLAYARLYVLPRLVVPLTLQT